MEEQTKNPTSSDTAPGGEAPREEVDLKRAASVLESLLLVSDSPLSLERIGQLLGGLPKEPVREVVRSLQAKYPSETSGVLVEEVAKGVQFRTNPANQEYVRRLFDIKPPRFSRAALETLSIIAYKQPVTRLEIEQIRGVDCAGPLKTLMERRLVKVVGKKDVIGRPFLFGTSREFMEVFGLASLSDLPSMRDIEDFMAAATGVVVPDSPGEESACSGISELAASLEAAEHEHPIVMAEPGLPEGVSDDVLSEAASREKNGEPDA
ncbi:MAG: SMC-Scp complex subunit ScpB [Candidatus Deferrimicrobiota bacterium]